MMSSADMRAYHSHICYPHMLYECAKRSFLMDIHGSHTLSLSLSPRKKDNVESRYARLQYTNVLRCLIHIINTRYAFLQYTDFFYLHTQFFNTYIIKFKSSRIRKEGLRESQCQELIYPATINICHTHICK